MSADACASVLKALGHPTRVKIVRLLSADSLCVCELIERLSVAQPTLSKHLSVLRAERLVQFTKEGNRLIYSLARPEVYSVVDSACQIARGLLADEMAAWQREA